MRRLWCALAGVVGLCAPAQADDPLVAFRDDWTVMATTLDITIYRPASKRIDAEADLDAAYQAMVMLDRAFSAYRADSELTALNSNDVGHALPISPIMTDVLNAARHFGAMTNGAFEISVQPLVQIWGFYDVKRARVPSTVDVEAARRRVGPQRWSIDPQARTATLMNGARLDLGGIAKGFAVDRAIDVLRARGVSAAFVNLGGNISVLGRPPEGRPWTVGIEHPRERRLIGRIKLLQGAVATSGDYDRYFMMNGQRYNHLIDPRTGQPVQGVYAFTVIAPTATMADAMSTAAFVLGPERGLSLLDECENTGGVVISPDGDQRSLLRARVTAHQPDAFDIEIPATKFLQVDGTSTAPSPRKDCALQ